MASARLASPCMAASLLNPHPSTLPPLPTLPHPLPTTLSSPPLPHPLKHAHILSYPLPHNPSKHTLSTLCSHTHTCPPLKRAQVAFLWQMAPKKAAKKGLEIDAADRGRKWDEAALDKWEATFPPHQRVEAVATLLQPRIATIVLEDGGAGQFRYPYSEPAVQIFLAGLTVEQRVLKRLTTLKRQPLKVIVVWHDASEDRMALLARQLEEGFVAAKGNSLHGGADKTDSDLSILWHELQATSQEGLEAARAAIVATGVEVTTVMRSSLTQFRQWLEPLKAATIPHAEQNSSTSIQVSDPGARHTGRTMLSALAKIKAPPAAFASAPEPFSLLKHQQAGRIQQRREDARTMMKGLPSVQAKRTAELEQEQQREQAAAELKEKVQHPDTQRPKPRCVHMRSKCALPFASRWSKCGRCSWTLLCLNRLAFQP